MKRKAMVHRMSGLNCAVQLCLAVYFFLIPAVLVVTDISDPALREGRIPRVAWRVHRAITPRYKAWARNRIASGVASKLNLYDVPSTEWPVFGSVFYLMATESLQKEWEKDPSLSHESPKEYASATIEAAKDIIMDPNHHWWVKEHWGENYLHTNNVFFRSLLISGLKSYQYLTGNEEYEEFLKDQCLTLADALDRSSHGVLDDYPAECYPIDVFAAVAWIKEAGDVTGLDQSEFISRAERAFSGQMLDRLGLLPYTVDSLTGRQHNLYRSPFTESGYESPSRGVGNSYFLILAPELYPSRAPAWYEAYEENFWQETWWAAGFREFSHDLPGHEWGFDVDAGPIIAGFSPAANAFGYAAAIANGRFDHSFTIGAQVLAACWPMPDGTLLGTKVLSDPVHAPYLGEVNLLWLMTRTPATQSVPVTGGKIKFFAVAMPLLYACIGLVILYAAVKKLRLVFSDSVKIRYAKLQFGLWAALMIAGFIAVSVHSIMPSMILIVLAQAFPLVSKEKRQS